ncbi:STAS domain-containing protein [Actinomycetospora endophytica]|uniref:Anti-sigma factor antagonist n=1 Tax=Actinomycetospora endophytica TaxID=2291215 RepID=A0ABS8PJN6_9PSEU|nr:STAS domain-containing protein [Actinomycetospora endophytica]MCD2198142.1 STAS domain-containing protein [Actinomycetospora endophytica]
MTTATVKASTQGPAVAITIIGEIDLENAEAVEEQLSGAIDNQATSVTIDLADLTYLDSAGLRLMFALAARLEVLQIDLTVQAPPRSPARRVLELSGFANAAAIEG